MSNFQTSSKNPEKIDSFFTKKDRKKTENEQKTENFEQKTLKTEKARQLKIAKKGSFLPLFFAKKLAIC